MFWQALTAARGTEQDGSDELNQQFLEFFRRHRLAEQKALVSSAAVVIEQFKLRLGFHALGYDIQGQVMRHADDGLDDHNIVGVGGNILDEGFIDLQLIQRQSLEIGER